MPVDVRGCELIVGEVVLVSFENRLHYGIVSKVHESTGAVDVELYGDHILSVRFPFPNTMLFSGVDESELPEPIRARSDELFDAANSEWLNQFENVRPHRGSSREN